MTAPSFPPPDATAAEVATWRRFAEEREQARRAAARGVRHRCSMCGRLGHAPGEVTCSAPKEATTRADLVRSLEGRR